MFAWEQSAAPPPDLMCLSKGITGGHLPLSCVLASDEIYDAFYDDDATRGFLHSHSYTGNALACAAALAVLDIFRDDDVVAHNRARAAEWASALRTVEAHERVRELPAMRNDLRVGSDERASDFARWCFSQALAGGLLLRPIGNTVYVMPPYIVTGEEMTGAAACIEDILDRA
jgi:adenosylmethionine-8-amino-7-oxononanoate aminotransferase